MKHRNTEFPETFLPGVARAADRALKECLDPEGAAVDAFLAETPAGLRPKRSSRRAS